MKRFSSNSVGPSVRLIDRPMPMNAVNTSTAVPSVPRQPQRSAPQNREKMKYTNNGLDGPSVRYWKIENATMSTRWVARGRRLTPVRFHITAARTIA